MGRVDVDLKPQSTQGAIYGVNISGLDALLHPNTGALRYEEFIIDLLDKKSV